MTTYTIKDARYNFAELIEKVSNTKEEIVITKYGKPKVKISPIGDEISNLDRKKILEFTAGIFKDREKPLERDPVRYDQILN